MYYKVLKENIEFTSPVGQKISAPVGSIVKIENLNEYEALSKEKAIEDYNAFEQNGIMTDGNLGPNTTREKQIDNTPEYRVGDLVKAKYDDDGGDACEGVGEVLKITKRGIRVDFNEKDQNYRIIQSCDIIETV